MPVVDGTPGIVDELHDLVDVGGASFVVWVPKRPCRWSVPLLDVSVQHGRVGVVDGVELALSFLGSVSPQLVGVGLGEVDGALDFLFQLPRSNGIGIFILV